eukprot:4940863-Prymnesium_polylepis.1
MQWSWARRAIGDRAMLRTVRLFLLHAAVLELVLLPLEEARERHRAPARVEQRREDAERVDGLRARVVHPPVVGLATRAHRRHEAPPHHREPIVGEDGRVLSWAHVLTRRIPLVALPRAALWHARRGRGGAHLRGAEALPAAAAHCWKQKVRGGLRRHGRRPRLGAYLVCAPA